jgi:hypothetical protein
MASRRTYIGKISIRRQVSFVDVLVGLGTIALLYGVARIGKSLSVSVTPGAVSSKFSTSLAEIPYYAACSLRVPTSS